MKLFALNAFLLLSVAAADIPGPQARAISAGAAGVAPMLTEAGWCEKCKDNWDSTDCKSMKSEKKSSCNYSSSTSSSEDEDDTSTETTTETTTTTSGDAGVPMLTEAGWCQRCKDDWNNKNNGCASMKSEKKDNCNYDDDDDDDDDNDRDSSSSCKIDEKKPSKSRSSKKYYFEIEKKNAKCLDKDKYKYEYGQYDDVSKFSSCAKKCVEKGPSDILKKLQGYNWNCKTKKCQCLYDKGTLKKKYDFDSYKTGSDYKGKGSVKKTSSSDKWNCAKLDKVSADLAISRRGLRGVN